MSDPPAAVPVPAPVLAVDRLTVSYATQAGTLRALDEVSLTIGAGETLALVGESGSGKSSVALAVMGLLGPEAGVAGAIAFKGRDIAGAPARVLRAMRGAEISIVFQDPFTALNPSLPVGTQVMEPLIYHRRLREPDARERAVAALAEVGLPDPRALLAAYPHQLSGGMQQRVLIATALICDPALVILDEPTTALDVTVEAQILALLETIRLRRQLSLLFISHNLGVVNRIADRIGVLYAGRIVESGAAADVLRRPAHPYTKGLLACLPRITEAARRRLPSIPGRFPDLRRPPPGCIFAPRCAFAEARCVAEPQMLQDDGTGRSVRCWKAGALKHEPWQGPEHVPTAAGAPVSTGRRTGDLAVRDLGRSFVLRAARGFTWHRRFGIPLPVSARRIVRAVAGVSFTVRPGEVLGLVGESGSGKSTLGRLVLRLIEADTGEVRFGGADVGALSGQALQRFRGSAQIVFQNPDSSLNPRWTIGRAIGRAVGLHAEISAAERRARTETLLDRVGLPRTYATRFPHQLSGGEKQRVGIARALATGPAFLVCDEPVSALDVSVQATVLNLLADLRDADGLSYLFISHDLSVVAHLADRIAVMFAGRIMEIGATQAILRPPYHPYTEALLSAVPLPDAEAPSRPVLRAEAAAAPLTGCPFQLRCPRKLGAICETEPPPMQQAGSGHGILCHIPLAELAALPPVLLDDAARRAADVFAQ